MLVSWVKFRNWPPNGLNFIKIRRKTSELFEFFRSWTKKCSRTHFVLVETIERSELIVQTLSRFGVVVVVGWGSGAGRFVGRRAALHLQTHRSAAAAGNAGRTPAWTTGQTGTGRWTHAAGAARTRPASQHSFVTCKYANFHSFSFKCSTIACSRSCWNTPKFTFWNRIIKERVQPPKKGENWSWEKRHLLPDSCNSRVCHGTRRPIRTDSKELRQRTLRATEQ